MPVTLRAHEPGDFAALLRLDYACFPPGIAYSKTMLRYFLKLPSADGVVAEDDGKIVGFILTEENPPLAHVITLDVAESHRRQGVGSALLAESEKNLALRGVRTTLEKYGMGWAMWDYSGGFGVVTKQEGHAAVPDPVTVKALGMKMPPSAP